MKCDKGKGGRVIWTGYRGRKKTNERWMRRGRKIERIKRKEIEGIKHYKDKTDTRSRSAQGLERSKMDGRICMEGVFSDIKA